MEVWTNKNLIRVLKENGVAVMPTDTIYGIVARAEDEAAVKRIYDARKRSPEKPCIILIGGVEDLEKFSINLTEAQKDLLQEYWPSYAESSAGKSRPVSVVLDCPDDSFEYLHRGTKTLAFRLPAQVDLQKLLKETGPLIAPSANLEGLDPAKTIDEAKKYFGDLVDLYIDGGIIEGKASKVIKLHRDGSMSIIRG